MFKIIEKQVLNESISLMIVEAPMVAKHAKAGQFIILRVNEKGERIPLTISDYDKEKGTITIIYQKVGYTTQELDKLNENDYILDFVGPLGKASELDHIKNACVIGGGLGVAIAYPQAKTLHELGSSVDLIVGFRNKDLIILEDKLKKVSDSLDIMTDDGSNQHKGFVTDALINRINSGKKYDCVIAIGPLIMMKNVCEITKRFGIKTIVSMNTLMIDGTGMCGCCRLTVDGKIKFACVDGPDFDGHKVNFDETISRSKMFINEEKHICNLTKEVR